MMSADCITLAHEFVNSGRNPNYARVFGMLIGGSKVQFCLAQAAVSQVPGTVDLYEIHSEIHMKEEWLFDIFGNIQT